MPLYEIGEDGLTTRAPAKFRELGLYERGDLQRLLRDNIAVLGNDLLVVAEEFGGWQDARRRIDLLAIDTDAHLTVIELKRTEDGGHMELQALRYAAMVSSMSFDDVASALAADLTRRWPEEDINARAELSRFLGAADGEDEPVISSEVRIILVSADFGRELMTTVLWLNQFEGLDIRCVQLIPYRVGDHVVLDVRQIVPLPEAADYQVRVRRKDRQRERAQRDGRDFTRYHIIVDGNELPDANKRNAMRLMVCNLAERGVPLQAMKELLHPRVFKTVSGRFEGDEAVRAAFLAADPEIDIGRYYFEYPLFEDGQTWIMTRMWGRNTEPSLTMLRDAFPDAGVSFRRAE
jgi:hypothetical protein